MYNLHLSQEQLEIRDTVRDFVAHKIKPVVLKAERLDTGDRRLPMELLDHASQLGLRTLALSADRGGVGADHLTSCIVTEELAVGDADLAATLAETWQLGQLLFDIAMDDAQRDRFLPKFLSEDRFHLAFAWRESETDTRLGVNYHRPAAPDLAVKTVAVQASDSEWIINGAKDCVANATISALFAVLVMIPEQARARVLLVPAQTPGVRVHRHDNAWRHGACGDVILENCRVPAGNLLGEGAAALLTGMDDAGRGIPLFQALNLGIGRAAYEAALDYTHLRVQGGRPIIEHQAIGTKLAEIAINLEVARAIIWQTAWGSDHPAAIADRSLPNLPLQIMARVFTSEVMLKVTKDAAEMFGAMGVMRDMPLQKYVHDARVCLHGDNGNSDTKLRIAEVIAGYRRATSRAMASPH